MWKIFQGEFKHRVAFYDIPHIDKKQVVEILLQVRQEPTYSTYLISWLL